MKKNIFVGILAAAAFGAIVLALQQNFVTGIGTTTPQVCMTSTEFIGTLTFEVKAPTSAPKGYSLQCQKAELFQAFMIYAPNTLSTTEVEKAITQDGAVVVVANDETIRRRCSGFPSSHCRTIF